MGCTSSSRSALVLGLPMQHAAQRNSWACSSRVHRPALQVEGFIKAAQKAGKGLSAMLSFRRNKTPNSPAGSASLTLDDLLHYSNVGGAEAGSLARTNAAPLHKLQFVHGGAVPIPGADPYLPA